MKEGTGFARPAADASTAESVNPRMDYLEGVSVQPARLASAHDRVLDRIETIPLTRLREGAVGLVGMGASLHAAVAAVRDFRLRDIRAYPMSATDLCDDAAFDAATSYVAVSASGRSRETVDAMEKVRHGYRFGITRIEEASPLSRAVDCLIPTFTGDDTGPCTVSYTGTLHVLGLMASAFGGPGPSSEDWRRLPPLLEDVLETVTGEVSAAAGSFESVSSVDIVGRGTGYGSAGEAALLLREKARVPASWHDTLNYLHGPMEALRPGVGVIVIGEGREVRLARDIASYGFATILLTRSADVEPAPNLEVIALRTGFGGVGDAILEIVPLQLLVARMAEARGSYHLDFRFRQDDTKL